MTASVADMLAGRHLGSHSASLAPQAGVRSFGAYDGAASSNQASDWASEYRDPNSIFSDEAHILGARAEDGVRNNPVAAAIIESLTAGTLGSAGLIWRSLFSRDLERDTDKAEEQARGRLTNAVERATMGTRFDANGQRSWRGLLESNLSTCIQTGNGFAARVFRPRRPGRQYQATCVRLFHASRVCNKDYGPDTDRNFRGLVLDDSGSPTAVTVRRYRIQDGRGKDVWDTIPLYSADGARQVTHLHRPAHPDQLLGVTALAPILSLLKQFGGVTDAYVVAKRIQACYPMIMETDDPVALARAAANGTLVTNGMRLRPGTIYVMKTGTIFRIENLQFNGADHMAFGESLLQLATAAVGLPYEVVINRLSKANLAAARAALMSAYRVFQIWQHELITQVVEPWIEWIIREDLARARLDDLGTDDLDLILRGKFLRPAVPTPDLRKDIGAVKDFVDLGGAPSDGFAMIGLPDFGSSVKQHAEDTKLMKGQGVEFNEASVGVDIAQVQQTGNQPGKASPSAPNADPADDPEDDPAEGADGEAQDEDPDDAAEGADGEDNPKDAP